MCGIVSIISKRPNGFFSGDLELFENLLVLDTLRGLDSTGVFSVSASRQVDIMKIASHPYHLFACEDWKKWRGKAVNNGRIIVGHNRKATKGSINSANAHPFHEDNIVLVHNGSLREDHKKMKDVEVDSHALCHAFAEKGAENVIPNINGAFALVWWDINKNRLFAVRNDERPLAIVETDDSYILLSEEWMALQLLARDHKKVIDVTRVQPGILYEFKIGGDFLESTIAIKEQEWVVQQHGSRVRNGAWQHGGGSTTSGVTPPKPAPDMTKSTPTSKPSGDTGTVSALTVVRSTTTSPTEDKPPIDPDAGHVSCVDYPRGSEVLVKYYEMKAADNNRPFYMARGKTVEPGGEVVDVISYIPQSFVKPNDMPKYLAGPISARITKHTVSTCGRSLVVHSNGFPEMVKVHNMDLTQREWGYVVNNCKCKQCDAKINDEEREFTSVSRKPNNKLSVTCADCIEDKLPGDMKYEFTQNRIASLQAYEQQRIEAGGSTVSKPEASSTPTLH